MPARAGRLLKFKPLNRWVMCTEAGLYIRDVDPEECAQGLELAARMIRSGSADMPKYPPDIGFWDTLGNWVPCRIVRSNLPKLDILRKKLEDVV